MLKRSESMPLQIIELLSIRPPPVEVKMKLLKEIAEEHEIDWDPSETETEYLKPHEDLLVSVCLTENKVSSLFLISPRKCFLSLEWTYLLQWLNASSSKGET
jgi:hypothetical protein